MAKPSFSLGNYRGVILLLILALLSWGVYRSYSRDDAITSKKEVNNQIFVEDVAINVFNPLGGLKSRVFTSSLMIEEGRNFYFKDVLAYGVMKEEVPFILLSEKAFYQSKELSLLGNNELYALNAYKGFQKATFSNALLDFRSYVLHSDEAITLFGKNFLSQAKAFSFDFKKDYFYFKDAQTSYSFEK